MRKLLISAFAIVAACIMAGCGAGSVDENSPRGIAEKSVECLKNKDFKGYVDLMYFPTDGKKAEEIEQTKTMYVSMLQNKYQEATKTQGNIKTYEFVSEEVKDTMATVKMAIAYENKNDTTDIKLKNKEGKWYLDAGK